MTHDFAIRIWFVAVGAGFFFMFSNYCHQWCLAAKTTPTKLVWLFLQLLSAVGSIYLQYRTLVLILPLLLHYDS